MNKLVMAMGEIGDDLILSALESVQTSSPQRGRTGGRAAVYRPARRQRGGVRVRVTAPAVGALALCAALIVWAAVALTGNHAEDPHAHGEQKIFSGFSEVQAYYPDAEMAARLAQLSGQVEPDVEGVALYYAPGTDWRDSENWNSLLLTGWTAEGDVFTVYCLFEGTAGYWLGARPVYESAVQGQIGDVQVHSAAQELADGEVDSWALFEVQGVVYEVLTANDTDAELRTWVLQELLGEN